jgi:DNA-binding transcriptional MocR family regulator
LHESAERDEPTLEITQEELAATLALSRQTVSRAFHDLASEGAIKPERRRVRLLDLEKLREHLPRWRPGHDGSNCRTRQGEGANAFG